MKKFMKYAALFVCVIFLAACGGGSESVKVIDNDPGPGPDPLPAEDLFAINFVAPDIAEITFGKDSISFGLMSKVDPADVEYIQWRGNAAGWNDNSVAKGVLSRDSSGVIHASVANIPPADQGNFVVKLKGSDTPIWFNGGLWITLLDGKVSPNATFLGSEGQFKYAF